ncbi:MAG: hypothetical protein Q7J65_08925, partial [Candidatus Marinimicrobia bacterium]|nr:hypothetical protein [Candidatus Neomarinimicrobiota bacterium]
RTGLGLYLFWLQGSCSATNTMRLDSMHRPDLSVTPHRPGTLFGTGHYRLSWWQDSRRTTRRWRRAGHADQIAGLSERTESLVKKIAEGATVSIRSAA